MSSVSGVQILPPRAENMQLSLLLWGDAGSGKTTLAATAPGTKLILLFDPTGDMSLVGRDDVQVMNLTGVAPAQVVAQFKAADPFGINKYLQDHPEVETVVVDSVTTLGFIVLQYAVSIAGSKSTIEQPGVNGWGIRNQALVHLITVIMRLCSQAKRHLIVITHEGAADKDDAGVVTSITLALSDRIANQIGLRFNEVWHLSDTGKEHRIAVRPCRNRKPMKTRLFLADQPEFVWHYDPNTSQGQTINGWYQAWRLSGGVKLALPTAPLSSSSNGRQRRAV